MRVRTCENGNSNMNMHTNKNRNRTGSTKYKVQKSKTSKALRIYIHIHIYPYIHSYLDLALHSRIRIHLSKSGLIAPQLPTPDSQHPVQVQLLSSIKKNFTYPIILKSFFLWYCFFVSASSPPAYCFLSIITNKRIEAATRAGSFFPFCLT